MASGKKLLVLRTVLILCASSQAALNADGVGGASQIKLPEEGKVNKPANSGALHRLNAGVDGNLPPRSPPTVDGETISTLPGIDGRLPAQVPPGFPIHVLDGSVSVPVRTRPDEAFPVTVALPPGETPSPWFDGHPVEIGKPVKPDVRPNFPTKPTKPTDMAKPEKESGQTTDTRERKTNLPHDKNGEIPSRDAAGDANVIHSFEKGSDVTSDSKVDMSRPSSDETIIKESSTGSRGSMSGKPSRGPISKRDDDMWGFVDQAKAMFERTADYVKNAPTQIAGVLDKMIGNNKGKETTIEFDQLTQNDAYRLLRKMSHLPEHLVDMLTTPGGVANLTLEEIQQIPPGLLYALNDETVESLRFLDKEKVNALCGKVMKASACPRNLEKLLDRDVGCEHLIDVTSRQIRLAPAHARILLKKFRQTKPPFKWRKQQVTRVMGNLGDAMTEEDINAIPIEVLQQSLKNISRADLRDKSLRRLLVKKLMSSFNSPTAWSVEFLEDMGRLLQDVDVHKLVLLRPDAVEAAAGELQEAEIEDAATRMAIARSAIRGIKAQPNVNTLSRLLPWLRGDIGFMTGLVLENFLDVLSANPNITLSKAEISMMTERLENHPGLVDYLENSTHFHLAIRALLDGFSDEFLHSMSDDLIFNITSLPGKPIHSRRRAKILLRKIRQKYNSIFPVPAHLFLGINATDIDQMDERELVDMLPHLQDAPLPAHVAYRVAQILSRTFQFGSRHICPSTDLYDIGKFAVHIRPRVLREAAHVPINLRDVVTCPTRDPDTLQLTKAQYYALVDNIRDELVARLEDGDSLWTIDVIEKMGGLVRGLTADDILTLPPDTELMSIVALLSRYEDELDRSQVEAVAEKIRQYYDVTNRNQLDDVDEVAVLQMGKFLQYFNSDFELTKFPKPLRPMIAKEMGRSSMKKISNGRRKHLLRFALKNTKTRKPGVLTEDVTRTEIDERALMDLGNLRCGLDQDLISKLTNDAVMVHIKDLQSCPFSEQESEALTQKALDYNMNRLRASEQMATMGPLLAYVTEEDAKLMNYKEMAAASEHVSRLLTKRDQTLSDRKRRGFIRERTSIDEKRRVENERTLTSALWTAMDSELGEKKCHSIIRLNQPGAGLVDQLSANQTRRCIDHIQSLDWGHQPKVTAVLQKLVGAMGFNLANLGSVDTDMFLDTASSLLHGLKPNRLSNLDLASEDNVAAIGHLNGLSLSHVEWGFKQWHKPGKEIVTQDIVVLGNLLCGAPINTLETHISGLAVSETLNVVGKLKGCSEKKLQVLADKVTSHFGTDLQKWQLFDVTEMGVLFGGLQKDLLHKLTGSQIKVIEPEVISSLPPKKIKDFTEEQLSSFTANQASSVTTMQRSYLSESQTAALGVHLDAFNSSSVPSGLSLVLVLASLRQLVVCFL